MNPKPHKMLGKVEEETLEKKGGNKNNLKIHLNDSLGVCPLDCKDLTFLIRISLLFSLA